VFYALVVYFAVRELIEVLLVRVQPDPTVLAGRPRADDDVRQESSAGFAFRRTIVVIIVLVISTAWGWRAMGLQYRLQRGAFEARSEWVLRMPPFSQPPVSANDARLTPRLLDEALHRGRTNPFLLWPPYARLWGEN
jgi:hypothetical protein